MKNTKISTMVGLIICGLISSTSVLSNSRDFLPYKQAVLGVSACIDMAIEAKANVAIVVIDRADQIIASARMDEVLPAAYEGAGLKAYSALNFFQPSGSIAPIMESFPAFKDIPRIVTIPGGHPVFSSNNALIGSVGVAGFPNAQQDAACALLAVTTMAES